MSVDFNFHNKKNVVKDFDQWHKHNNDKNDPALEVIRKNLSFFEESFNKMEHGICWKVTSPRVIKTVRFIAEEILRDCPEKLKKLDGLQVYYGCVTQSILDKDDYLRIKIDPKDILQTIPDFELSPPSKIGVFESDLYFSDLMENYLIKYPTILNFWVGHEVIHYKYDDCSKRILRECAFRFDLYKEHLSNSEQETRFEKWYLKELEFSREAEMRADCEALKSIGTAQMIIELFSSRASKTTIVDGTGTHPSYEERVKMARQVS